MRTPWLHQTVSDLGNVDCCLLESRARLLRSATFSSSLCVLVSTCQRQGKWSLGVTPPLTLLAL